MSSENKLAIALRRSPYDAEEDSSDESGIMKKNLKEYAADLMGNSLVTGVSNIVKTKNKCRKGFKILVLLLCTCGFFYQATEFVKFFLTYPSVVGIEVYVPKTFTPPAYTYCNNNGIKRTKFCSKYPNYCESPENVTEFCEDHEHFCRYLDDLTNFTVVKQEFYDYENYVSYEELVELGHDLNSFRINSSVYVSAEDSKPIYGRREDGVYILCYTAYLRVDSRSDAREHRQLDRFNKKLDWFEFDLEPDEVFQADRKPGALFNLHSPFLIQNPFQNGIFLTPSKIYMVHLRMEEEHLLPYPYQSNCMNYTDLWLMNNRTGPRSQEICMEKCELDLTFADCNCTFPEVYYPNDGPFCTGMPYEEYCQPDLEPLFESSYKACSAKCKDDCHKLKYRFDFQSRLAEAKPKKKGESGKLAKDTAMVNILVSESEVVKYKYRPQYQVLEVFSYVGGFIGAWMGISLVAVVDMFESLVMIATFCFRRKSPRTSNDDETKNG